MDVNSVGQGGHVSLKKQLVDNDTIVEKVFSQDNKSTKPLTEKNIRKAVNKFNALLEDSPTHFEYEVYGKFRDTVIKIVDDNTKKVVKELPPKNIIDMVEKFCEMAGLFINRKV